jgi:hypothetical protein
MSNKTMPIAIRLRQKQSTRTEQPQQIHARSQTDHTSNSFVMAVFFLTSTAMTLIQLSLARVGIGGFAIIPFVNIATIGAVSFLQAKTLLKFGGSRRLGSLGIIYSVWVGWTFCAALIGIAAHNSLLHIVAWVAYSASGLVTYSIVTKLEENEYSTDFLINSTWIAIFMLLLTVASITPIGQLYDKPFVFSFSIYLIFCGGTWVNRLVGALLLVFSFSDIGEDYGLRFGGNRASYIAVYVALLAVLFKIRRYALFAAAIFLPFVLYSTALTLDQNTIDGQSRNVREAIMLARGDSLDNNVATQQRLEEVDLVIKDIDRNGWMFYLTGMGLGRTLDMSGLRDSSPGDSSISGSEAVNNIHFLPVALVHKYGAIGLFLQTLMLIVVIFRFVYVAGDICKRRVLFAFLCYFATVAYGMPASNFYIADVFLGYCLAVIDAAAHRNSQSRRTNSIGGGGRGTAPTARFVDFSVEKGLCFVGG